MYERMLEKSIQPTEADIREVIGANAAEHLQALERALRSRYDLTRELRFPFGNHYGWGYKYAHKKKHLCYAFFEKGAFTVMLQLGGHVVPKLEKMLPDCSAKTQAYWDERYPCGEGGWIQYRVLDGYELDDLLRLLECKQKPVNASE